jgi:hypothetical protein
MTSVNALDVEVIERLAAGPGGGGRPMMRMRSRRVAAAVVLAVMLLAVGMWSAGVGFARAGDAAATTVSPSGVVAEAPVVSSPVPSLDELRARADYVSPDGREVRIGDVGISAAPAVSRTPLH